MAKTVAWPGHVLDFIRLGRPHFLAGGFILNGLGAAVALYAGAPLSLAALLGSQVVITATQAMTHYSNDFFDQVADRANRSPTHWSGGSRMLTEGRLAPAVALGAALALAAVALAAAAFLTLVTDTGPFTLPLAALLVALAWSYSSPPIRLHARGLGEVVGALVVSVLTPLFGYYVQAGHWSWLPFLAILPLYPLQFAMLISVSLPDAAGDAAAGKRTLRVLLGGRRTAQVYALALFAAYAALPMAVAAGLPAWAGLALLLPAPLAAWQGWRVTGGAWADPRRWNSVAFWTIALLMGSAGVELLAFAWSAALR